MQSEVDPFRQERVVMFPDRKGLKGVRMIGRYNYTTAKQGLTRHSHAGSMEICYLVRGYQTYQVDQKLYRLRGGDIFITRPDEVHSTAGLPQEKGVLYWIIFKPIASGDLCWGLETRKANKLWQQLQALPSRHFSGNKAMRVELDSLTRAFHNERAPMRGIFLQNHFIRFLTLVIDSAHQTESVRQYSPLTKVLRAIEANPGESFNNESLAAIAGLSEPRFKARFKEEMGVPPREYLIRHRLELACEALKSGHASVTEIAHALGFSSSQYFATCFKRYYGCTPTDYLAKLEGRNL